MILSERDLSLIEAIQDGLPLVSRPYAAVGAGIGMSEAEVIERLRAMLASGVIKRLGVVVRHHELGYRSNAMVVWDVPEERMDEVGQAMSRFKFVTLCYQRPRRLPQWRYNLFCMIHGRDRDSVLRNLAELRARTGFGDLPHDVLFSRRRFKQRGAIYRRRPGAAPTPAWPVEADRMAVGA